MTSNKLEKSLHLVG